MMQPYAELVQFILYIYGIILSPYDGRWKVSSMFYTDLTGRSFVKTRREETKRSGRG